MKKVIMASNGALPEKLRELLEKTDDCLILSVEENEVVRSGHFINPGGEC